MLILEDSSGSRRVTYASGHHHPVIQPSLTDDANSDIKTEDESGDGYDEGDKSSDDEVRTLGLRVDVVRAWP